MLAIYFDNGELLTGDYFQGYTKEDQRTYIFTGMATLQRDIHHLSSIRLGDDDDGGWWYPIDRVVKFKDLTDEEVKQLQRDGKLNEVLQ